MKRASSSLPVPLSASIRTSAPVLAAARARCMARSNDGARPTMSPAGAGSSRMRRSALRDASPARPWSATIERNRLGEIVKRAVAHGAHCVRHRTVGGQQYDGRPRRELSAPHASLPCRAIGHAHIGHDQVELAALDVADRLAHARRRFNAASRGEENSRAAPCGFPARRQPPLPIDASSLSYCWKLQLELRSFVHAACNAESRRRAES